MSEIKFSCPHCDQHVACDDAYCGERITCPACGKEMFVPRLATFTAARTGGLVLKLPVASKIEFARPTVISSSLTDEEWSAYAAGVMGTRESFPSDNKPANWLTFFAVLLAPAISSMVGLAIGSGELVMFSTFIGSGSAGIVCGRMLAARFAHSAGTETLLTFVFAVLCGGLSFFLCFVGCVAAIPLATQIKNR